MMQKALEGMRYRVAVPFINPYWHGYDNKADVTVQWLDFCVWSGKKMFVVLFGTKGSRTGGAHPREKLSLQAKVSFLKQEGIPYIVVRRDLSSIEYKLIIKRLIRKENL